MRRMLVPVSVMISMLVGAYAVMLPSPDLKRSSSDAASSAEMLVTRCRRVM